MSHKETIQAINEIIDARTEDSPGLRDATKALVGSMFGPANNKWNWLFLVIQFLCVAVNWLIQSSWGWFIMPLLGFVVVAFITIRVMQGNERKHAQSVKILELLNKHAGNSLLQMSIITRLLLER